MKAKSSFYLESKDFIKILNLLKFHIFLSSTLKFYDILLVLGECVFMLYFHQYLSILLENSIVSKFQNFSIEAKIYKNFTDTINYKPTIN